jgi:hypothetical protein
MGTKKYSRGQLPPCPDPERYALVKTEEGYYWRRKRGTVKPAKLNPAMNRNAATAKITAPAASRLLRKLATYTHGIKKGRINLIISGMLMKTYHTRGVIDFSMLEGLELNMGYPLEKLFYGDYTVIQDGQSLRLKIELTKGTVQRFNNLVTDYNFEAVLLYGDTTREAALRTDDISSALYSFAQAAPDNTELVLSLPDTDAPWMMLLKINCLEGNELAAHPKHYAMKVVKVHS